MLKMDQYELIRTVHHMYGKNISEIVRETESPKIDAMSKFLDKRVMVLMIKMRHRRAMRKQ